MDEDDSQDELINRSSSHSKGKRAALWPISDDSDDLEEESEDGDFDSGDEEEEHNANGEDDEEEDSDEEDDNDEEEDAKPEKGAFEGSSAGFAEMSSDEDREKCPICLNSFTSQPVATPENCEHYFCFDCILEWTKNANSCPVDRIVFDNIYLRKSYGGKVKKIVTVQKPAKAGQEETVDLDLEQTNCEVCGGSDREDRLLLCDGCDAGYHMECLTPPLDAVPVEEWFCPECEANNHQSRGSAEEISDTESMSSTPRPATSRPRIRTVGPTRAIARTQQSERVRANVNRHRITQARTSQLAPTYLMQSTWLDETINAVVAGLNTAVYVRDITTRAPSSQRRRAGRRRKVRRKKTSAKGKNGLAGSTGVKRRKRRVRKRKKAIDRKVVTPRGRIANNLGIVKDKKSSSLPTVYRPVENTLSSMRADIGAASLSIYGDPFDLDPFVDHEEVEEQARVTSLLEAKRRGISRSALRSHQPVARPVTAGLSRRAVDVPHSGSVVEAAPVPDLLGSILSGQSILLMDSSDVVISRDGSLKTSKTMMPSTPIPSSRKTSSSSDASALNSPGCSYNLGDNSASLHHNGNLSGSSPTSVNGLLTPRSPHLLSFLPPSANHNQLRPHSDLTWRANPSLQPPHLNRSIATNGMRALIETPSSSVHPIQDSNFRDKGMTPSQSQPKKAPVKPMWVDVSVLPRIPKIKRESSRVTNDGAGLFDSSRGSSNSTGASNVPGLPESGMNSLSGDKGRQHSVDQQKGHSDGQAHKNRPERANSSSAFSNSFASSSSTTPASQPRHASFSSSSAVSFRISSSGNSWHARRLSTTSSSSAGSNIKEQWREKEKEAKKKQMHKDKKTLLASCTTVTKEQDNIYDPFNPTLSDSSSSSDESETTSLNLSPQSGPNGGKPPTLGSNQGSVLRSQDMVQVKTETEVSQENPGCSQHTVTPGMIFSADCIKVEKESNLVNVKPEKQMVLLDTITKKEPHSDDSEKMEPEDYYDGAISESELKSKIAESTSPAHQHEEHIKAETNSQENSEPPAETSSRSLLNYGNDSSASCSSTITKKQTEDTKSDSPTCSSTLLKDMGRRKQSSKTSKNQLSSSSETDRGRREDHHVSDKGGKKDRDKGREKDRSSRRSRSRERRRAPSTSDSSQPKSPDRTYRKRRRSRSRSKDKTKRRSRSSSSSSSRERSRMKKHNRRSKERNEHTEKRRGSKDKRHGRSRSKSRSVSRSRSRTRSRDRKRRLSRSRSQSRSRERRKDSARQHATVSSRDKVDSRCKDRRQRTRSSSRERRKDDRSTICTDTTSASHVLSSRDRNLPLERKKEKEITQRNFEKNKCAEVKKQELPSCSFVSQVKNEDQNFEEESQTKEMLIVLKNKKEIKKEKPHLLDMFEDCPTVKQIKSEENDAPSLAVSKSDDEVLEDHSKTESCETTIIKSETSPTEECPSPPVSSPSTLTIAELLHDSVYQSQPGSSESSKQQNPAGVAVPIKQEPSESDDDFNVDVMLDSLDNIKSEQTEASDASAEQEKEAVEEKYEGEQISAMVGSKSKAQVKRVTWNIQEPEGPQPEKSQSKLALYKLKLKQEGLRKPSLPVQASTQGTVGDPSTKGAAGLQTDSSGSGGLNPGELSTTEQREAEEGDLSRKDKYLKKLHMQERAVEEVKLAIKPFYQKRDINKDEYKEILRKAVQKVCHSKSGEINPVKVGNLIKAYVEKYKHARKHKKGEDSAKVPEDQSEQMKISDSP